MHLDVIDYFPKVLKILNVFKRKKKNYRNQILGAGLILHFLVCFIEAYLIIRILCPFPKPLPWYKSPPWTRLCDLSGYTHCPNHHAYNCRVSESHILHTDNSLILNKN